jgi:hypothetical protein
VAANVDTAASQCPLCTLPIREYELLKEAHAFLSVIINCSSFCHPVYPLPPQPAVPLTPGHNMRGSGWGEAAAGVGEQTIHREREFVAVKDDIKLSVGFFLLIFSACN